MGKITSFTDLRSWQNARQLAVSIYKTTKEFPADEKFGLTSQMRRAGVSVAANIAEGFSRNTAKDKVNFYSMALGSLTELISHCYISFDLEYLNAQVLEKTLADADDLERMIRGLMKTAQGKNT